MTEKLAFWRWSVFPKVLLVFIMIISPFYLIGIALNDRGAASVYSEMSESMTSRLHFYTNLLELEFDKIIRFQNEFVNDDDLIELSGKAEIMTDPEKTFAMSRLQKRLLQLKYSSSYIENVSAYIPSISYVLSANKLYDDLPDKEFAAFRQLKAHSASPIIFWSGRLFIVLPSPGWTALEQKPPVYLLAVEISLSTLAQTLGTLSTGAAGGAALYGDKRSWSIASPPEIEELNSEFAAEKEGAAGGQPDRIVRSGVTYMVLSETMKGLGATINMFIPESEMTGQLQRYHVWYWILSLLSVVAIVIFALWIFRTVRQPLRKLVRAFRKLETGDLSVVVSHGSNDEFHTLYDQFNSTVRKLKVLIEEVYEQKYRVQLAELRQLQSQINPHFLYNSFFSMQAMARLGDIEGIGRYTKFLGDYFQYVTRSGRSDMPLRDEVNHVRVFAEIQRMRFRNRIDCIIEEIPPGYEDLSVPRLILQPLAENAFKYGLENKKAGGLLAISFYAENGGLLIILEDNGEDMDENTPERLNLLMKTAQLGSETTGLVNVCRRLQIRFGSRSGLSFFRGASGGLRVVMHLPADIDKEERMDV